MTHIITISNQKGGVAKTTTAVNLAACLGAAGHKTLLVDLDPQSNATSAFGIDPNNVEYSTYESLLEPARPTVLTLGEAVPNVSVLPSTMDLAGAEIELMDKPEREYALQKSLSQLNGDFEFVLIDSPPSLGLLTLNALVASQWVIIPVQAEYFALEGLSRMIVTIQRISKKQNPNLRLMGILPTLFDGRTNLANQVLEELHKAFPDKLFRCLISRSVRLSEAPSFGKPIIYYDARSTGAEQYQKLCQEVLHVSQKASLGQGLDALLGAELDPQPVAAPPAAPPLPVAPSGPSVLSLAVVQIRPNPFQPRHTFRAEALEELTASIQEKGILQPLIVRRDGEDFQIVAGERRWRAAQQAGLREVPVIVREYTDQEMLELALIENLQREELSAVEEARAYRQLIEEFELTQEQVAERVGKSRVAVTNSLRLLRLPRLILEWTDEGKVSAGHGRALLSLESEPLQMVLAREIMAKGLSVREVEKRVRRILKGAAPGVKAREPVIEIDTRDLQEKLTLHLGLQVKIFPTSNTSGKIEVQYSSLDEFQRFFDHIGISFEQDV